MKPQGGKPSLKGAGVQQFPEPGEKSSPSKGGKITGTGRGAGKDTTGGNPFTATYDSRPHPGDNKPGATRPGKSKK